MLTAGADSVGRAGANNYRMKFGYVTVSTHGQSIDAETRQHLGGRGKKQGCEGDSVKSYARLHILFERFEHKLEKGQYLSKTFSEFERLLEEALGEGWASRQADATSASSQKDCA